MKNRTTKPYKVYETLEEQLELHTHFVDCYEELKDYRKLNELKQSILTSYIKGKKITIDPYLLSDGYCKLIERIDKILNS